MLAKDNTVTFNIFFTYDLVIQFANDAKRFDNELGPRAANGIANSVRESEKNQHQGRENK